VRDFLVPKTGAEEHLKKQALIFDAGGEEFLHLFFRVDLNRFFRGLRPVTLLSLMSWSLCLTMLSTTVTRLLIVF